MDREWFFYMVRCNDGSLYSGIATRLEDRVKAHNSGKGAKYTAGRRPVSLVYSEKHQNLSEARKREIQVQKWKRLKKEQLVAGFPRRDSEQTNPTSSALPRAERS